MSTILVVDDMAVFRQPIAAALKAVGYEVVCAADGHAALKALETNRIDLVLLDLAMPSLNGIEVLRILRQQPKHRNLPVVMLTAISERDYIAQAAQLRVTDYLLKSRFSLDDLLSRIRMRLEQGQGSAGAPPHEAGGGSPGEPDTSSSSGVTCPEPRGVPGSAPRAGGRAPESAQAAQTGPKSMSALSGAGSHDTSTAPPDPKTALNSLTPVADREEVENAIAHTEGMKGFSPTVMRLMKLTNDPNCSIDLVVNAICRDHAVALTILKLANSVAFTRGEPVDAVRDAVLRIGLGRIRQVVLSIGVVERFAALKAGDLMHAGQFWEHAIACGVAAGKIADLLEQHDPDVAFTAGLLHDVGRLVLLERLGDTYIDVLQTARDLELPVEQVEKRMLHVDHAEIMDRILSAWRFSPHLATPIINHHLSAANLRGLVSEDLAEAATLALANRLVHGLAFGCSGNAVVYPTESLVDLLRLNEGQLRRIENTVVEQTADLKVSMLAKHASEEWPQMSHLFREQLDSQVRFAYHSDTPDKDAFHCFCRQIGESDNADCPKIGVVHLASDRQRAKLSQQVLDTEAPFGGMRLPLLIISPCGEKVLEGPAMKDRTVRLIRSPVPISRFIRAVNELLQAGAVRKVA